MVNDIQDTSEEWSQDGDIARMDGPFSTQRIVDIQARGKNVPFTWIPIKESNPSKITLHYFKNGKWISTGFVRCIPWPEAFPPISHGPDAA